ncbi:uncharacterized protein N0V89_008780 [Didymosphaeria variabile]|uniref:Uncharacterized protein n=1 Tax=Didymosphaeria variabile TaxID=1932322 RepID=A0A9W8XIA4_9PLEO|nr:uncharacterized protein N0V89_008780 [Didymosphaeria variabile]KAJ4350159.1 hypothetical protein N0V89_008780 [Didymosphaeria variabile]
MARGTINTLALGILTPLLVLKAAAQICYANENFFNFNSSKTVSIPALRLNGNSVIDDPDNSCCSGDVFNSTIPQECASLVGGGSKWRGGMFSTSPRLDYALDEQTLKEKKCPQDAVAVNSSMHGGSGTGTGYNQTVRFPQPYFLMFWPNRTDTTGPTGASSDDVRVELLCLRTDEIEEGSPVPGSAKEILDEEGVKYAGNASGTETGTEDPSSTKGVATMKTIGPYLGAAAMAGLLLV